jgi:hypothetical protein
MSASSWCAIRRAPQQIYRNLLIFNPKTIGTRYADGVGRLGSPQCQGGRPGNAMTAEAVRPPYTNFSFSKPGVSNEIRHRNHQAVQA